MTDKVIIYCSRCIVQEHYESSPFCVDRETKLFISVIMGFGAANPKVSRI